MRSTLFRTGIYFLVTVLFIILLTDNVFSQTFQKTSAPVIRSEPGVHRMTHEDPVREKEEPDGYMVRNGLAAGCASLLMALAIVMYQGRQRRLEAEKLLAEQNQKIEMQRERLAVINEEMMRQNVRIWAQTEHMDHKKRALKMALEQVDRKNAHIAHSRGFAKYVQATLLHSEAQVAAALPAFILFKPRDLASGDFYWFNQSADQFIIAAADCTGHGIEGALMSTMAHSLLNHIVGERNITLPDAILSELHAGILNSPIPPGIRGSIEIAICVIDRQQHRLEYAGAKRPLYLFQQGKLHHIRGNKTPVGGRHESPAFARHTFDISEPSVFYMGSDGYSDQFGGAENKRFTTGQLKKLLSEIHQQPMPVQKQILDEKLREWQWQGSNIQVDDVLLMGIQWQGKN